MRTLLAALLLGVLAIPLVATPAPARACDTESSPFTGKFTGIVRVPGYGGGLDLSVTLKISKDGEIKGKHVEFIQYPDERARLSGQFIANGNTMSLLVEYRLDGAWVELFTLYETATIDGDTLQLQDAQNFEGYYSFLTRD